MAHFTEEQLKELKTILGLTKNNVLAVRDGFVHKDSMVWWRSNKGPLPVKAGDPAHWDNIRSYPQAYQLKEPAVQVVYKD